MLKCPVTPRMPVEDWEFYWEIYKNVMHLIYFLFSFDTLNMFKFVATILVPKLTSVVCNSERLKYLNQAAHTNSFIQ